VGLAFDDFAPGQVYELGETAATRDEIVRFAREFDPQPFHVDEEAARASRFGGLIASGWHSCSLLTRLMVDRLLAGSTAMGSPGADEVRWLAPLRPGARLSGRATVVEARPSERRPDRGSVRLRLELLEGGEPILSFLTTIHFGRRAEPHPGATG
jgi:acyl dehydratase